MARSNLIPDPCVWEISLKGNILITVEEYLICLTKWDNDYRECSGSVVECLTRYRGAAGLSLTSVTVLCP